jgi:hypothetical protein
MQGPQEVDMSYEDTLRKQELFVCLFFRGGLRASCLLARQTLLSLESLQQPKRARIPEATNRPNVPEGGLFEHMNCVKVGSDPDSRFVDPLESFHSLRGSSLARRP